MSTDSVFLWLYQINSRDESENECLNLTGGHESYTAAWSWGNEHEPDPEFTYELVGVSGRLLSRKAFDWEK